MEASRTLALSDEILLGVEKPARYTGGELNSVMKNRDAVELRVAFCFPDVYEIGMSHLGIALLYDMLNRMDGVWCERVFCPWPDLDAVMREKHIPLFALESQDPVKDFNWLAFTLQYEMCYTNVLQVLDLCGIPLRAAERGDDCPIVMGGGPCSYNPEPLAEFFDLFYIGEGETQFHALADLYMRCRQQGFTRQAFLYECASIPGIYVPSLYECEYHSDGSFAAHAPVREGVPAVVGREIADLDTAPYPVKPIVPNIRVTQDKVTLEVMRGCIRGCRFCQAGMTYRPARERTVERLLDYARQMLTATGCDELTLSSLSTSDYTQLPELLTRLIGDCNRYHVNISLPSLRVDAFSLDVMSRVQDIKKSSLTFAPEAGSQRLRDIINKGISEEEILGGVREAFTGGWSRVKLYFMMGLPYETDEDVTEIARLSGDVVRQFYNLPKDERAPGRPQVTASAAFFVPKPMTPFQWARQDPKEEFERKAKLVKAAFGDSPMRKNLKFNYHESGTSVIEGVLARGDRRLAAVIQDVYESGEIFDAWTEYFHYDRWLDALERNGLNVEMYTRARDIDETLPWDFIDCGVSRNFLAKEWERARQGIVTPNCRMQCNNCGITQRLGGPCPVVRA